MFYVRRLKLMSRNLSHPKSTGDRSSASSDHNSSTPCWSQSQPSCLVSNVTQVKITMALVDYESSSSEGEPECAKDAVDTQDSQKSKRESRDITPSELPPLPSKFLDMYASTARTSTRDDSSLHEGRKRMTPHIEGNWPSHLYIEWCPGIAEHDLLSLILSTISREVDPAILGGFKMGSLLISDLGAPRPLHISLSRPIGFRTDQKDLFLASLLEDMAASGIRPFTVSLRALDWVPNFEKTRWFLVLRLQRPENDELNRLLAICNKAVQEYSQPPLYASPSQSNSFLKRNVKSLDFSRRFSESASCTKEGEDFSNSFHISIGWALEQPPSPAVESLETLENEMLERLKRATIKVDTVKAKIGSFVTSVSLLSKAVEVGELFTI